MCELFGTGQSVLVHFIFNRVIERESHSNTGFVLCFATLYHIKRLNPLCTCLAIELSPYTKRGLSVLCLLLSSCVTYCLCTSLSPIHILEMIHFNVS